MAGMPKRRHRRRHHGRKHHLSRDRGWRGNRPGHRKAARKGWKLHAKPRWRPTRYKPKHHTHRGGWKGNRRRHEQAAARGWRRTAKKGWRPKHRSWHGSTKSTAEHRGERRSYVKKMSKRERSARNRAAHAKLSHRARAARLPRRHHKAKSYGPVYASGSPAKAVTATR